MNTISVEHAKTIELIAFWEGRINTTNLQKYFDISRQTASKLLKTYRALNPDNLTYDPSIKGLVPTESFKVVYSKGTLDEYRMLLSSLPESEGSITDSFSLVTAPLRNISPQLVRPIINAIRHQLRLDVGYASISSPEFEERIIAPHSLVFSGQRWHVRAHCEKNNDFRDFVLSRFNGVFNEEGAALRTREHDEKWNTWIDLAIEPDPRLSDAQKRIVELDFQMTNGQRVLNTRAALLMYLLQSLHLDQYKPNAEAQQIIVNNECWKKVEKYLPK